MARLAPPIPQDKIQESFVWRDWFQRLSDRVYGTMASQDAGSVTITGGNVSGISLVGNDISGAFITGSLVDSTPIGLTIAAEANFTTVIAATITVTTLNVTTLVVNSPPVTKTADFVLAATETWVINNKAGSTCTVTLPSASTYPGRVVNFLNYQPYTIVSASSNVIPRVGGAASTAIVLGVEGNWATLVSNGTNWVITQAASNNNLLLE